MTENFYHLFLDYISPKEKQRLCSILQKRRVQINGFSTLIKAPTIRLANIIAKGERKFFKILQESYSPVYTEKSEAVEDFSPDTAVACLTYFVNENCVDEDFLSSLLEQTDTPSSPVAPTAPANTKYQKKYEEFRQKYLSANKELEQLHIQLNALKKENDTLRSELDDRNNSIALLQEKILEIASSHEKEILLLRNRLLSFEVPQDLSDINKNPQLSKILVLTKTETSVFGADTLQIDNISQLPEIIDAYNEVLFIANDLPFHIKRAVNKIAGIQGKMQMFPTNAEMIEYIKKGRNQQWQS